MGVPRHAWMAPLCAGLLVMVSACEVREQIEENYRDVTSHEAYTRSLRQAGLDNNAVVRRWSDAAGAALSRPLTVRSPFEERGVIEATDPRALGFRVDARRGQRIQVNVEFVGLHDGRVFVELFRRPNDSLSAPYYEAGTAVDDASLEYAVPRTGTFVVRVQPELLLGGEYRVEIQVLPTLAFPVDGVGPTAILSRYGASRDGGRRSHRGVDIFAPRGTPVLAAAVGRVSRVDTTNLGGYVVWLREEGTRHSLYYAHLDRQLVEEGQRVAPGDTLGLVGNTGNARTTPPHLHFGIYRRGEGALDPFAFIEPQDTALAARTAPDSLVGQWVRATARTAIRVGARRAAASLSSLESGSAAQVVGITGPWVRVRLPDGNEGYALASQVTPAVGPIPGATFARSAVLRMAPRAGAPQRVGVGPAVPRAVVARHGGFGLVFAADGREGWVELDEG